MNSFIRHIGIVDKKNRVHSVSFQPGLNVVTGKSSTGKSALIEIFDFCFGSSDFTVPEGVITNQAEIYFTVIRIEQTDLVLGRKSSKDWHFIKAEADLTRLDDPNVLTSDYFDQDYTRSSKDYKLEIGRWLGLQVTDTLEDETIKEFTGRKTPSPSIRSFASFMLQHQNLIANKHAVFYRFDEKEKREQAIDHLKIFLGFADQAFFLKSQELNKLRNEVRVLEIQIPKLAVQRQLAVERLQAALNEFGAISGNAVNLGDLSQIVRNPIATLKIFANWKFEVNPISDEHLKQRQILEAEKSAAAAKYRSGQRTLEAVQSSIRFARTYDTTTTDVKRPVSVELSISKCPFCGTEHNRTENEANKLLGAITWLNDELTKSRYRLESFEEQERKAQKELDEVRQDIGSIDAKISILDKQTVELAQRRSQYELALKSKLRIESILEELTAKPNQALEDKVKIINEGIKKIQDFLEAEYGVTEKLAVAEKTITKLMEDLGKRFEFEESYRPIKLHFSLETFDLWHQKNSHKVFLRSMGSGANWLYSHLTLFLALHRYFCSLGNKCSIPSILFIDQPSQVYFPSQLDNSEKFSPETIAQLEGEARKRPVDEDIKAVTNLYSQLIQFCEETRIATKILPQIIVTDHADNLTLADGKIFGDYVRARWRDRGFIEIEESDRKPERAKAKV